MDDASLDDFRGETDGEASEEDNGADASKGGGEPDVSEGDNGAETVGEDDGSRPTRSTYRCHPDGAECAACGATVRRRWRDDSRFVCTDCKAW